MPKMSIEKTTFYHALLHPPHVFFTAPNTESLCISTGLLQHLTYHITQHITYQEITRRDIHTILQLNASFLNSLSVPKIHPYDTYIINFPSDIHIFLLDTACVHVNADIACWGAQHRTLLEKAASSGLCSIFGG